MSDFDTVLGFEERLPPASPRRTSKANASPRGSGAKNEARARLSRIANGALEVMVKINGRIRERRLLRAHLVHLTISSRGENGERLHPSNAELWTWRRTFAQALRDRGVEAEATPRWARGVTRKAERYPLRKIRELHAAGKGRPSEMLRAAYHHAAGAAFLGQTDLTPWERQIVERQTKVRSLYLRQAAELVRSSDPADQALGQKLEAFVREMPRPDSQRLALARELRAAHEAERRRDRKERDREEELER